MPTLYVLLLFQMVENMSSSTADALGLSRAILCNDSLVKKLDELERTELMYKVGEGVGGGDTFFYYYIWEIVNFNIFRQGLVDQTKRVLRGYFDLLMVVKEMGDIFCNIGVRLTME